MYNDKMQTAYVGSLVTILILHETLMTEGCIQYFNTEERASTLNSIQSYQFWPILIILDEIPVF